MSSAPPPSPLGAPDLRRQLQQRYEEAQQLAARHPPDHQRIHDLLAECLRADPGSILYLDALLANLRRWRPKPSWLGSWWKGWNQTFAPNRGAAEFTSLRTPYSVPSAEYAILQTAPERLLSKADDAALLGQLAAAAGACEFDQVELRYLDLARELAPDDADTLRLVASALARQGRFEDASAAWERVRALAPGDAEVERILVALDPAAARQLDESERALADEQAAGGPLLSLLATREALQLERAQQRLAVARRLADADPHPKAQRLVEQLQAEHDRLQIEILNLRCERLPGDWQVRLELARCLKRMGNFSGAIQRLDEATRLAPQAAAVWIELGECWQHLRQFAKALAYYERAIPLATGEELALAKRRAAVLRG
jgi:Flp pilus assembly protein TadD